MTSNTDKPETSRKLLKFKSRIHITDDFLNENEEINALFYDDPVN